MPIPSRTLFLVACLAVLLGPAALVAQDRPPNIVLIFADDMGYGDLSSYGHPTIRTPRLDRMAHEGIRLTGFYVASPACSPSRAALLTGRYPIRSGVTHVLGPDSEGGLPPAEITLAEALKAQGYRTAMVGKWHLGTDPGHMPTDQGFDEYFGLLYSNDMIPPWVQTARPLQYYRGLDPDDEVPEQATLTERYTDEAVRFIREAGDAPFFLYLPHAMPHLPIAASDTFRGRSRGGLYGDVIETLDWSTGQILDALAEEGLDDNTIVIFTSDNGPWTNMPSRMYDTPDVERWHAGTTGPLSGHKGATWEGGQRVPAIVRWPGHIPGEQVSSELATAMDLYTTLIHAAGGEVPEDRPVDGRDILPLLRGEAPSPHEAFFYTWVGRVEGVRDADWKLRIGPNGDEPPVVELYDMQNDPYERYNVADLYPEIVERLRGRMAAFAAETGATLVE